MHRRKKIMHQTREEASSQPRHTHTNPLHRAKTSTRNTDGSTNSKDLPGEVQVRAGWESGNTRSNSRSKRQTNSYPLHRVTLKRHQGCLTGELRFENVAANVCRSQPGAKRCAGRCRFKCAAAERCVQSALLQVNTVTWPCRGAVHLQHQIKLHHETLQPQVSHCLANTRKN